MPDRSAESGEYVSAEEAKANPATTVHETTLREVPFEDESRRLINLAMGCANRHGRRETLNVLQRLYDVGPAA